jgi:hypothetical protein
MTCPRDSPRLDPLDGASAFDPQARVEDHTAGRHAAGRIEIGFDHLGNASQQKRETEDYLTQGLAIERLTAAKSI